MNFIITLVITLCLVINIAIYDYKLGGNKHEYVLHE